MTGVTTVAMLLRLATGAARCKAPVGTCAYALNTATAGKFAEPKGVA